MRYRDSDSLDDSHNNLSHINMLCEKCGMYHKDQVVPSNDSP